METPEPLVQSEAARRWPAALAALSGSTMVGFMPLLARRLYADGLGAPSMLFWRYDLAIVALAVAALFMQIDLRRVLRGGGWRIVLPLRAASAAGHRRAASFCTNGSGVSTPVVPAGQMCDIARSSAGCHCPLSKAAASQPSI